MAEASRRVLRVGGMTCGNCESRIERALGKIPGVARVKATAGTGEVEVEFDPGMTDEPAIRVAIGDAGYQVRAGAAGARRGLLPVLGLLAILLGAWLALRFTGGAGFVPVVTQSMGYGLVFVVGLLTSLHCIGMCGGIALSQGTPRAAGACADDAVPSRPAGRPRAPLSASILYNAGRVLSYTVIGGVVGGIGSVIGLSLAVKALLPVVAGAFMAVIGIRMLGIFPWLSRIRIRLPGALGRRLSAAAATRGPFVVGLLNGLMPCGPLQTMQVYALGTGSVLGGALSMFLFSLGTVPLMLGLGALGAFLNARFARRLATASGALVAVLGLVMLGRGLTLSGVALPGVSADIPVLSAGFGGGGRTTAGTGRAVARLGTGVQEVATRVTSGGYQPLVVQEGVPVRWTITVSEDDLNGCNNPLTVPRYGITRRLVPGANVIEFTPDSTGTIVYTCWMGMISSTITVVQDLATFAASGGTAGAFADGAAARPVAACSCCTAGGPAPRP